MSNLYAFGSGETEQLPVKFKNEDWQETKIPLIIDPHLFPQTFKIYKVVCGGLHTLALSTEGEVFSWGCNDDGAVGRICGEGCNISTSKPARVDLLGKVNDIAAGDSHSVAYNYDSNKLYFWGGYRVSKKFI